MKRFYQTDTSSETGNCIKYAVASLLEVEPDKVPDFEPTNYIQDFIRFFNSRGFQVMVGCRAEHAVGRRFLDATIASLDGAFCLLGVKSFHHPRVDHCVVGMFFNGEIRVVHDPNRDNGGRQPDAYEIREVDIILPTSDYGARLLNLF